MTRISLPPSSANPSTSAAEPPVSASAPSIEEQKGGQAELHLKKEDLKGNLLVEGSVLVTPPDEVHVNGTNGVHVNGINGVNGVNGINGAGEHAEGDGKA